jgi:hypothetical protein
LSYHSEEKDLRITKVPAGVSSILVEAGPNPANDNSAVWVNYQVGRGGGGVGEEGTQHLQATAGNHW